MNNNAVNIEEEEETPQFAMMRTGKLSEMDRSLDIEYWQRQGDAALFKAAWEMVELYYRENGLDVNELRLQKHIENFQRRSG